MAVVAKRKSESKPKTKKKKRSEQLLDHGSGFVGFFGGFNAAAD